MEAPNIGAIIREVVQESTSPDPEIIAKEVLSRLTVPDQLLVFEQILTERVADELRAIRYRNKAHAKRGDKTVGSGGRRSGGPSRHVAAVRELWRERLRESIAVGDRQYRFLGDCTAADLTWAAEFRNVQAKKNRALATWFDDLAALVEQHDVATVGELPEGVLRTYLSEQK